MTWLRQLLSSIEVSEISYHLNYDSQNIVYPCFHLLQFSSKTFRFFNKGYENVGVHAIKIVFFCLIFNTGMGRATLLLDIR